MNKRGCGSADGGSGGDSGGGGDGGSGGSGDGGGSSHTAMRMEPGNQDSASRPSDGRLHVRPSERLQGSTDVAYRMMSRPRGLALVISNVRFQDPCAHPDRIGGDEDERALGWLLTELDFQVEMKRNLNGDDMRAAIAAFVRREEHGVADCAVLAIMTHGEGAGLFGVDWRLIAEEDVIALFSNQSAPLLAGKPKWLILQAFLGPKLDSAFSRVCCESARALSAGYYYITGMKMPEFNDIFLNNSTNPGYVAWRDADSAEFNDIFLTHSTIPGYVAWRDADSGSWLVQALCEVFTEWAHCQHLSDLHFLVQRHIDRMPADDHQRQTVEFSVRGCTKRLYFNPGL